MCEFLDRYAVCIFSILLSLSCFFLTWCQLLPSSEGVGTFFIEDISLIEKELILTYTNTNEDIEKYALMPYTNEVIVVLWKNWKKIWIWYGTWTRFESNISLARDNALQDAWVDISFLPTIDSHLFVLGERHSMDDRYIHGLHAVKISNGQKSSVLRPSYPIETNRTYKDMIDRMCDDLWYTNTCDKRDDIHVLYSPASHIVIHWTSHNATTYYRWKVLERYKELTSPYIEQILSWWYQWLWKNLEGDFTYVYNPSSWRYSTNNNMIRQLMASRLLAEMAAENDQLLPLHKENLTYIFDHWYQQNGDAGYVYFGEKSKLWAIAMLVRVLVASPVRDMYNEQLEALTTTLLSLLHEDGSFSPWYIAPGYAYDTDYLLTFYSGEAILALVELYQTLWERDILEAVIRAQNFYLGKYVDEIDTWYYPAYVPWHTLSLYHLYHITGDERYATALFLLNDKLIDEMLHTDISGVQDIIGRFYNPVFSHYGTPHSASDGVYLEWIVYAYRLAHEVWDAFHEKKYRDALTVAVHNIAQLQYQTWDMYFLSHPERVEGAIRFRADDNRIRIDTTQHAMDGLRVLKNFLETK